MCVVVGCAAEAPVVDPTGLDDQPVAVPLGKEDNFFSVSAREYLVEGRTTIVLDAEDAGLSPQAKARKVQRLIPFKQVLVTWFLNAWVAPKDDKDPNAGYGGFNALAKNATYDDLAIVQLDDLTFEFTVQVEVSGSLDLMERLPVTHRADGSATFDLIIGVVSNDDMQKLGAGDEWFRKDPWGKFDPAKVPEPMLETLPLTITPIPASPDAWVDTPKLFEDGLVTIGVHFGWDYHDASHIKESKLLFDWLVKQGYRAPVANWDALERTSGPFKRTITAGGRDVRIELSLFYGKPGTKTDPDTDQGGRWLKKDMIKSLQTREVIIYSGHSGPFWGFSLGNWKKTDEGELEDNEITAMELPSFYQLVLAEGCETYAMGDAFFSNPAKRGRDNIDIITTSTYSTASNADPVKDFLGSVVGTDDEGAHVPVTFGELLKDLDWNAWDAAMYGIHGVDDAPHLHPYAEPDRFCDPCTWWGDCGDKGGNFCLGLGTDGRFCSAECTGDDGCPSGYVCAAVARGQSITSRACVPRSFSCQGDVEPTREALINEVLADPPDSAEGDLNEDGWYDAGDDEFVEIVNLSSKPLKVGGWSLSDGTRVRFTFPPAAVIPARGAGVIFGGGDPSAIHASTGAMVWTTEQGLQLANAGDSVILRAADGRVIDRIVYGAEAGDDRSLTRAVDADPDAAMVPHPENLVASPGTAADLTLFQ